MQKCLSGFIWLVMMCDSNVVSREFAKAKNEWFRGEINTADVKEQKDLPGTMDN